MLTQNDRYRMIYFDGLNRFYLRREYSDLQRHFETPPNVFDEFTPVAVEDAKRSTEKLQQRVTELEHKLELASHERDGLSAQVASFKVQSDRDQARIAELNSEVFDLNQRLRQTRLWVGQLSQQLAAVSP